MINQEDYIEDYLYECDKEKEIINIQTQLKKIIKNGN